MRTILRIIFLSILCTLSTRGFSADTDTTKPASTATLTRYFNAHQFEYSDSVNYIDNSLYDFQKYLPKTILGNTGQVIHDQSYNPFQAQLGFNYFKNNGASYFYTPQRLGYFNSRTPYTDLEYITGSKKEQLFKMAFSYNVTKNWNLSANYYNIHSDGFYPHQNTKDNFIAFSTNFKSRSNRYWILGSIIYNGMKTAENGGMNEDSAFVSRNEIVSLQYTQRTVVNRNISVKQFFNFGKSASGDTAAVRAIIPESHFSLATSYDDNYIRFVDSLDDMTSGYYPHLYYDSAQTHDSTYYRKIENELEWKRVDNRRHRGIQDMMGIGVSLKHQLVQLHQHEIDTTYNNIFAGAQLFNTYSNHAFWWNAAINYGLNGYNEDDFLATIAVRKLLADSLIDISLCGLQRRQQPDFIYERERSNSFIWNNHFEKIRQTGAAFSFKMDRYHLELKASINIYTNAVYFDTLAMPRQYGGTVPVLSVFLKKDFTLANWHLNNKVTYQSVPNNSVIRMPQYILEHALYYERDLIGKALRLQIGASVYYSAAYYADAYMPVTGQFYLQDRKKYGDYPFIDVFLCARVKTVRVFFKVDNVNSGLTGNNYILTPGYYYPGRTFKFGVSWKFYD